MNDDVLLDPPVPRASSSNFLFKSRFSVPSCQKGSSEEMYRKGKIINRGKVSHDEMTKMKEQEAAERNRKRLIRSQGGRVVIVEDSSEDELIPFVSDNIEDEESEEVSRVADNIHRHDLPQILDSSSLTSGIGKRRASDSESERYRKKKASQKDGSRRQVIQSRKWIDRTLGCLASVSDPKDKARFCSPT
ncbi:hypothetical protein ADUPG1_011598, partial [Aduncisulcus paluster]